MNNRLRQRPRVAEILLYHTIQPFVKRKVVQKSNKLHSRICATLPVDFWGGLWYTIIVKRERKLWRECSARIRRSSADNNRAKKVEKISTSLLTNPLECDTIRVSRGRRQSMLTSNDRTDPKKFLGNAEKPLDKLPKL
jgi:hypothetical protein